MRAISNQRHSRRLFAILAGAAVLAAAIGIGLLLQFGSASDPAQQKTFILHDGDTLDSMVDVPEGTYLIVKSDQEDHDADVTVTGKGGFIVEKGAVLVLENVNLASDKKERSTPVFSVYGDMVMNDGSVEDFESTSAGAGFASFKYGKGGVPAISIVDGTFTMNDGTISGNSNSTTKGIAFGGALRAEGKNASVIINDGTISGNQVVSSAAVLEDSTVSANALGGAIAVTEGASVTVNGGEISDNTAGSHNANAKDADSTVCSGNGGAIAVYSSDSDAISSLYLGGGSITNNNAFRTGADKGAAASLKNETHGGGIFSNVYTKAVLTAGRIAGNTSDDKGGGVFLDSGKAYGGASFKNTLVSDNEAESLGGGLWFCPNGEADMFSEAKTDGIAVFDNTTTKRGTDGAGDDLYVSPRSGDTGVTVTGTMLGGGNNSWYQDGGASTQTTSSSSSRYTTSDTKESASLLQASAVVNKPSAKAETKATSSATVRITNNRATYGGGVGSNHYLSFGTPTKEEKNVPADTTAAEKISINVDKVWIGDAGTSATVHLYANGDETKSATLTSDNDWSYTFTGLRKTDSNGKTIKYTLKEDAIDGYESDITGDAESGFTVTNTKKISIPVTKKWVGDEGTEATVHLLANGTEVASKTLTSDDGWSYTFTDLDQAASDGNEISYTLTEDAIDGYESDITGDAESGFTVTNTKKISIPVTKVWSGGTGSSATVHLLANGTEVADATLTADNDWSYTFEDLDQADSDGEISYTLTEDSVTGYTSSITGDAESGFTVTNTKETISIPVTKKWVGGEGDSATVHLLANGSEVSNAALTADNDWTYTFTGLDKYDSSGNEISYTLTEDAVDGYTSEVTGNASSGFTVTNTKATISIPVTINWIQTAGSSATVHLLANGTEVDSKTFTTETGWTGTFTDLNQTDSSGNPITYTLTADTVDGYTEGDVSGDASSGFTVKYIETVKVHVEKQWSQGFEPSVTIRLKEYESGNLTDKTVTLSADVNWEGDITDVPKYDSQGNEIIYTLTEEGDNIKFYRFDLYPQATTEGGNYSFIVVNSYSTSG
ncbi:MAG: Cna B-type domain-containing protein [Anaerovoracaceae bacterium]|jgi:predicted metal-binding protein